MAGAIAWLEGLSAFSSFSNCAFVTTVLHAALAAVVAAAGFAAAPVAAVFAGVALQTPFTVMIGCSAGTAELESGVAAGGLGGFGVTWGAAAFGGGGCWGATCAPQAAAAIKI